MPNKPGPSIKRRTLRIKRDENTLQDSEYRSVINVLDRFRVGVQLLDENVVHGLGVVDMQYFRLEVVRMIAWHSKQ